jgi:aminopeptidase YwaD
MTEDRLAETAGRYLRRLCVEISGRQVGSPGNRAATDFFSETIAAFGFAVEAPEFDCLGWRQAGADLRANGEPFEALVSPYSLGCQVSAPLLAVADVEALEATEAEGKILLVHGGLAREPLMPKNFPFYNPDEHRRIIRLLEEKKPLAIVAATSRSPEMAGAVYPFPLIEDGDFDIPSVYMTEDEGRRLAAHLGHVVSLDIGAWRSPATGCNVIARRGSGRRRAVMMAHIDAKEGTPGALDNAAGAATLLLLAELLEEYAGELAVEIVAMNGEDYFSNPGEQQYLRLNTGKFDEIALGINLDGLGYHRGQTAYSLYDCPPELAGLIRQTFARREDMAEGEQWVQGDHSLFLLNGRPALALTSEYAMELLAEIVHTPKDNLAVVDAGRLAGAALALRDLLTQLQ